jgi:hypothetical protein
MDRCSLVVTVSVFAAWAPPVGAQVTAVLTADNHYGLFHGRADSVYLLNHLFLGGPEPPGPYPAAGVDPTGDMLGCRGL